MIIRIAKRIYRPLRSLVLKVSDRWRRICWILKINYLYSATLIFKKCYFGPFTGEFGHLLGHNLPFIAFLHSKGVKINFCGMELHKPFFVDDKGNSIVSSYLSLRDFYSESAPNCNMATEPEDIGQLTSSFIKRAKKSIYPYWDNRDHHYYFYFFRWWIMKKGYTKAFELNKVYSTGKRDSVVIFPRKWNTMMDPKVQLINNGKPWNYMQVAKIASEYFEKVYVIGHPAFSSVDFESFDNIKVCITQDNEQILRICSASKMIITPHSGSVYLGEYTDTPVLVIYQGGSAIGNIEITKQFKNSLGSKHDFRFAFSYEEIAEQFEKIADEKIRN